MTERMLHPLPSGPESPDEPLDRTYVRGKSFYFARAVCTLEGTLPAHFEGVVGAQSQGIFRPLEISVERGVAKIGGVAVTAGGRCKVPSPRAVGIAEWLGVRMENPSGDPVPFRISLLGHCGEPHDPAHPVRTTVDIVPSVPVPEGSFVETFELPPNDRTP